MLAPLQVASRKQGPCVSNVVRGELEEQVVVRVFCSNAPPQQELDVRRPVRVGGDVHVRILQCEMRMVVGGRCAVTK